MSDNPEPAENSGNGGINIDVSGKKL